MKKEDYSVAELLDPACAPYVLRPVDVAQMLDVSVDYARLLFQNNSFPSFSLGSRMCVLKKAFLQWLDEQRYDKRGTYEKDHL